MSRLLLFALGFALAALAVASCGGGDATEAEVAVEAMNREAAPGPSTAHRIRNIHIPADDLVETRALPSPAGLLTELPKSEAQAEFVTRARRMTASYRRRTAGRRSKMARVSFNHVL